jgi:Predicted transcriptional regulator with C-terminal CBS domains
VESSKVFGENLRRARKEAGLSQEALGFKAGLHTTEISRLERAVRDPRLSTIYRVAAALGVEPATLVSGSSIQH